MFELGVNEYLTKTDQMQAGTPDILTMPVKLPGHYRVWMCMFGFHFQFIIPKLLYKRASRTRRFLSPDFNMLTRTCDPCHYILCHSGTCRNEQKAVFIYLIFICLLYEYFDVLSRRFFVPFDH